MLTDQAASYQMPFGRTTSDSQLSSGSETGSDFKLQSERMASIRVTGLWAF